MPDFPYHSALIVGAGAGISASLARRLSALGVKVGLAARDVGKLGALVAETGATAFEADAAKADSVAALFEAATRAIASRTLSSIMRAGACAGPSPNSIRRKSSRRWG
jgi:NADP-dependent 3-hydroxy acid dehydrogenase YdfG